MINTKTQVCETINDLRTVKGRSDATMVVLGYYSAGDWGNPCVYKFNSSSSANDNSGTIIKPTPVIGSGRWVMQNNNQIANVKWFGAKGDGSTDDYSAIVNAMSCLTAYNNAGVNYRGTLYFPRSSGDYYCSQTLTLNGCFIITGDEGSFPYMVSRIQFPVRVAGIIITAAATRTIIKNIELRCNVLGNPGDVTYHGIQTDTVIYLENVAVRDFSGDGLLIDTSVSGNANLSVVSNCHFYENRCNNIHLKGNDSNAITIINPDCQNAGRCGILDESFLGNRYYSGHIAYSGSHPRQDSIVSHSGGYYYANSNNINIEPTVTPGWQTYWTYTPNVETPQYVSAWASGTQYYATRPILCNGEIQTGDIIGVYTEGGQNLAAWGGYNVGFGGTHGAQIANGSQYIGGGLAAIRSFAPMRWYDNNDPGLIQSITIGLDEGLYFMSADNTAGYLQFKSINGANWVAQYALNSTAFTGIQWPLLGVSAAFQGRSGNAFPGCPHFQYTGFFAFDIENANQARNILFGTSVPTTLLHAAGDVCINIGSNAEIIGWKCISDGTPGTWTPMYSTGTSLYISKNVDYVLTGIDSIVEVTATGKTITLPTAVGISGKQYTIKLTASGSGTVNTTSSQTIDGSLIYLLASQNKYVTVISNNSNWVIIGNN